MPLVPEYDIVSFTCTSDISDAYAIDLRTSYFWDVIRYLNMPNYQIGCQSQQQNYYDTHNANQDHATI